MTTTVRFYHSEDATITRSDTQLATGKVEWPADQLYHQETWTAANVKAPSSKGSYYYGACVDAVAGESDTTNNCSAAVTVTLLHNKPDLEGQHVGGKFSFCRVVVIARYDRVQHRWPVRGDDAAPPAVAESDERTIRRQPRWVRSTCRSWL